MAGTTVRSYLDVVISRPDMTPEERAIVKAGCLINYNRNRH